MPAEAMRLRKNSTLLASLAYIKQSIALLIGVFCAWYKVAVSPYSQCLQDFSSLALCREPHPPH